jgi:hypothetical protein
VYYESLAAQGVLPAPDGSVQANTSAGIVGAVVGLLTITLSGFMISKAYKKKQLMKEQKKYTKSSYKPGKDEESPFTPYTSQPTSPRVRSSVSLAQTPTIMKNPLIHLQTMETYRTSHGPVHVKHASNRRLSTPSMTITSENVLQIERTDKKSPPATEKTQTAAYYNSLRLSAALPKPQRPLPPRIKTIQIQQQQRMLRLAKEDGIDE